MQNRTLTQTSFKILVVLVCLALIGCKGLFRLIATGDPFNPTFRFEEKVYLPKGTIMIEELDTEKRAWVGVWRVSFINKNEWINEFSYRTVGAMDFSVEKEPEQLKDNVIYRVGIRDIRDSGIGAFCIKKVNGEYVIKNIESYQIKQEEIDACTNK